MHKITKKHIFDLDPVLYSDQDKQDIIHQLFGGIEVGFSNELTSVTAEMNRWSATDKASQEDENKYRINHASLIEAAGHIPSWVPGNRVSDFTNWVFRLYNTSNYKTLARAALAEREIARRRIPRLTHSEHWKLIYNGMGDNARANRCAISNLSIKGEPIYGSPDLVFRDKKERRVLILELKATTVSNIPSDGWPNLRAQLWAYSQIDKWADVKEILLVSETWGVHQLRIRKVIGWNIHDKSFQSENKELWEIYKMGNSQI